MATKTRKSAPVQSAPVQSAPVQSAPVNPHIATLTNPSWYKDYTGLDARPDSMIIADHAKGIIGQTTLGQLVTNAVEAFNAYRGAGSNTYKALWFAWTVHLFVAHMKMLGQTRAAAIKEMVRYLIESGAPKTDANVSRCMHILGLAMRATNAHSFDQIPHDWMRRVSEATLRMLMKSVERHKDDEDDLTFHWVDGWKEFTLECLDDGMTGLTLERAIEAHELVIAERNHELALEGLTDDQLERLERQRESEEKEKKIKTVDTAIKGLVKKVNDSSLSTQAMTNKLADQGIITRPLNPGSVKDVAVFLRTVGAKALPSHIMEAFSIEDVASVVERLSTMIASDPAKSA